MVGTAAGELLATQRANAALGWLFSAFLCYVAVESVVDGDLQWALFVSVALAFCLLVPVAFRDPAAMLPWEVVALAALPTFGQAITTFGPLNELFVYVSVAALALVIAVQLDLFTRVRMTVGFAVAFVVLATLATAGVWALVRWALDLTLGTETLLVTGVDDATVHDELMLEFLYSALAGVGAGLTFQGYFRRRRLSRRLPAEVTE